MKKILLFALIPLLLLSSCESDGRSPLFYQESAATVSGTLYTDTGVFYVTVTLSPYDADAERRDCVIKYSYPSEMSGYEVTVNGGNVTVGTEGLTVPLSERTAVRYLDVVRLFTLDGESLYSAEKDGNGELFCSFSCYGGVFVAVDPDTSLPVRIGRSDGSIDFKIDNYLLDADSAEDGTDPAGTMK